MNLDCDTITQKLGENFNLVFDEDIGVDNPPSI